jgi:eukaryotic-like serine/threonine-protein kinase
MINRRDALKLGAAGLMAPAIRLGWSRETIAMQEAAVSWPMHGGNPARTGVMVGEGPSFGVPIVVRWGWNNAGGGSGQWSTPIVYEGALYHSPGIGAGLLAFDFETGAERWQVLEDHEISYQIASNDTIFAVVDSRNLYALDPATGQELWHTRVDGIQANSMVAVDSSVYCRTDFGGDLALNHSDGSERWCFEERADDYYSSIAVHGETLYFGSLSGALFALDTETGSKRWQLVIPAGEVQSQSKVLLAEGTLYLRDYQGSLYALDPESRTDLWRTPADATFSLSAMHNGRVYGSNAELGACALDGSSGQMMWNFSTTLQMTVSGVFGDTVIAQGTGSWREMWRVHGLDAATGQERWSFECPPRMYDPTIIGNHLMMHGLMGYVLGNLVPAMLSQDVVLRGGPSPLGVERGMVKAGDELDQIGPREQREGQTWVEVTIGGATGWIPLDAIDPATLPPDGEIEYVYIPD